MFSRNDRIKELLLAELASALRGVKDPGISGLMTVTGLDLAADRKVATVYYSVMGDAAQRKSTARALRRATPFVRRTVAQKLTLKVIPEFVFTYDDTPATASRIEKILSQIAQEKKQ